MLTGTSLSNGPDHYLHLSTRMLLPSALPPSLTSRSATAGKSKATGKKTLIFSLILEQLYKTQYCEALD